MLLEDDLRVMLVFVRTLGGKRLSFLGAYELNENKTKTGLLIDATCLGTKKSLNFKIRHNL